MQRLGDGFLVKRMIPMSFSGGGMAELYELPSGQWQIGRGKDATVVTSLDQVGGVSDSSALADITRWVEKTKHVSVKAVVEGPAPVLAGHSTRDQLSHAIANMPEEAVNRILLAITQTMGPIADSVTQHGQTNHHGDGFGQDQTFATPGGMPQHQPFVLPPEAQWVDPNNHASGYYTPYVIVRNAAGEIIEHQVARDAKGNPTKHWNPGPAFEKLLSMPEPASEIDAHEPAIYQGKDAEEELKEERSRELVGAGGRRTSRRR
ncbi:MAG: hypothetical protein OEY86_00910 [Nitrospira sp.]|nr:hypothetical protein [Nitrospira sp.]